MSLETRYQASRHLSEQPSVNTGVDDDIFPEPASSRRSKKLKGLGRLLVRYKKWLILAVLILAAGLVWRFVAQANGDIPGVKKDYYQAVFLSDGTQYVGKLTSLDAEHYRLTGAYFIASSTAPVVSDKGSQQTNGQVALVKLETGLLSAENEMTIPKDKVLFYENLKKDGQAAKLLDANK